MKNFLQQVRAMVMSPQNASKKILTALLKDSTGTKLAMLNKILATTIPFNSPHHFNLTLLGERNAEVIIPYKRINQNHLKGVHACAMATAGEFCSGVTLLKLIGYDKYRLIMRKLSVEYFYQGRTDLSVRSEVSESEIIRFTAELESEKVSYITMLAKIIDKDNRHVADVTTEWQLKDWNQVKSGKESR